MINTKQTGPAHVDISMSNDSVEVFPVEEDLVNDSQQVRPAQISIPGQLLLEEMSRSEKNGNNITAKINALLQFYFIYWVPRNWWLCISLDNKATILLFASIEKLVTLKISLQRYFHTCTLYHQGSFYKTLIVLCGNSPTWNWVAFVGTIPIVHILFQNLKDFLPNAGIK